MQSAGKAKGKMEIPRQTERKPCRSALAALILTVGWTISAYAISHPRTPARAGAGPIDFESPAAIIAWQFYNGAEFPGAKGSFEWARGTGRGGGNCARLHFDFTGGGNYVQATIALAKEPPARAVRLWIKKPGAHRLTFRSTDSKGQTFQKSLDYEYGGWQQIVVDLTRWAHHWGGPDDGVFRGAPASFAVLVENTASEKVGDVLLDDVEILTTVPRAGRRTTTTTYNALTFPRPGAIPNRWSYDFRRRGSVGLGRTFSLMGRPLSVRLVVESDGSGHELRMTIGSHFQNFERTIGSLIKKGRMEFSAPLGDMREWRHYGGENDGRVRLPLRFISLVLAKKGRQTTGSIAIRAFEVTTEIDADRPIVAVPSAHISSAGTAVFNLTAANIASGGSGPVTVAGEMRDFEGRLIKTIKGRRIDPSQPGTPFKLSATAPMGDRVFLEALFWIAAKGSRRTAVRATVVKGLENKGDGRLDPSSRLGMGLYLYRYPGTPEGLRQMDKAAALAEAAGVKWSREEFNWARIERRRGQFDWDFYDKMVETAHRHGISIYGLIAYWAPWTKPYTAEGIEDYCRFARALVEHYKGKIRHWEIWNEPNIFFWSGPRDMYADLLKRAYAAIKQADPDALVLGCSTAGIDTLFVGRMIELGAPFDILTIHPYRRRLDEGRFVRQLLATGAVTKRIDGRARPVWITEMGWSTQLRGGVGTREQATLLARSYVSALGSGVVENISWYDFKDDGDDPFYNEHNFGVLRRDLTPKPAYRALATVCRQLNGCLPEGEPRMDDDLVVFRFRRKDGRRIVAAWTRRQDMLVRAKRGEKNVAVVNLMGEPRSFITDDQSILFVLRSNEPTFIHGLDAAGKIEPVELRVAVAPPTARPGEKVSLGCNLRNLERLGFDRRVEWEVPIGWRLESVAARGRATVQVPADAGEGTETVWLVLRQGSRTFRLRLPIRIAPSILRI